MAKAEKSRGTESAPDRRPIPECVLTLKTRVKKVLKDKGWKQADLARKMQMNPGQLSGMIRSKNITAAAVVRLAEGLEVDAGWLLTDKETDLKPRRIILTEGTPEYDRAIEAISKR